MQICGCCRKNESRAEVPPFCVPPITKLTRTIKAVAARVLMRKISACCHRFADAVGAALVSSAETKWLGARRGERLYNREFNRALRQPGFRVRPAMSRLKDSRESGK